MRPQRPPDGRLMQRCYERGSTIAKLLLLALLLIAPGCGNASRPGDSAPTSANAAHQAWVAALRAGGGDAALALVDPAMPEREPFAREAVARMREYLTSPASPTGALEGVTLEPVVDGVGRSVWQFAQKRWCYRAELVRRDAGWYVSRWGQTSVDCQ
ncbi:MAG: hypothetical protein HGA45_41230 [Chloroflexales bacterium]|nr:hypothetical protein [Chloroflexales bacterium]